MPWWDEPPKRSRAYAFRKRVCRQRIAQALGKGRRVTEIAAVERCAVEDIDALLKDRGFQALVRHWEEVAALDPAARLARLEAMAMDLLELAVAAGDLRVAMFVAHERRAGRHPGRTVAEAVVARLERPRPPPAPPAARAEPSPGASPANAARHPFAFCAPTLASDAHAMHLAEAEAARVPVRLARVRAVLAARLAAETERAGTAFPSSATELVRAVGRSLRRDPGRAIEAAVELDEWRRAWRTGEPAPAPDTS